MSDINAVNFQVTQPSASVPKTESTGNSGFIKKASSDFQDLVRQIARDKAAAEKAAAATAEKLRANAALDDDAQTALLITAEADAAQTEKSSLAFDLSGSGETTTLDANGLKTLKAALDSLLHGLPADQKPAAIKLNLTQLQKIMQDMKVNAGDIQSNEKSLIATGLSPEQLTKLAALIAQASNMTANQTADAPEKDDGLKAVLIGILKIVPDESAAEPQTIFLPKTLMVTKDEKPAKDKPVQDDIVAASMTALVLTVQAPPPVPTGPMNTSGVKEDGIDSGAIAPDKKGGGFDDVLKMFEQPQGKPAHADKPVTDAAKTAAQPSAGNSTTSASFAGIFGAMTADGTSAAAFPDGLDWSKASQFGLTNTQITNPAQLTSLVTQASATQAHPATQVVAATLARTFEGGETKHLTLRLDPPELGKIEIHMQFTKDKSVKTHMIFEKPETMLMMQRDQNALQQSLQDAGMNGDGSGLSFELASHDNNPFQGGQGGNGNNGRASGGDEPQLIETTMSWSVDAETGMKHYNVLV